MKNHTQHPWCATVWAAVLVVGWPAAHAAGTARSPASAHAPSVTGDARIDALLARMTLQEKISLLHGAPEGAPGDQGQAGYWPGLPRLGIPSLRFADGPPGVLTRYPATALPATMALAATFDVEDARANGVLIAHDARALGIDVVLEPYINIDRDPTFARAYNTYGEDPLLTGAIGAALITGVQSEGVLAQAKHFIAYEGANDVSVGEQALHEIYLAPFAAAADAGVSSVMCSYNRIGGRYACGNRELLDVLRAQLGFKGFVTSDWGATHDTLFVNDGLDLEMPGSGTVMDSYFDERPPGAKAPRKRLTGPRTTPMPEEPAPSASPPTAVAAAPAYIAPLGMQRAVRSGRVSEATITQAVGHILLQVQRFGLLDRPRREPADPPQPPAATLAADAAVNLKTAEDAAVLLKNEAGLPLTGTGSIAMIGPGALQDIAIGQSGEKALGRIERQIGPSAALQTLLAESPAGTGQRVLEAAADDMTGAPIPAAALEHDQSPGLQRFDAAHKPVSVDAQLDFTRLRGNALPAGSSANWSGALRVPGSGRYRLYLQVLGASGELMLDGQSVAATGPLDLHGNVLQPGQDNVLPTRDGLDNVRRELSLTAGVHPLQVHIHGDASGQSVQVRLAWVSDEQRQADYRHAVDIARTAATAVVFAWSRNQPNFGLPGDQDQLIADVAAANPNTVVVLNVSQPVAMPWLDKVRGVLLTWYPGDEGGRATAALLAGKLSPAGRLPFTWPKTLTQNVANDPAHPRRGNYSEGILVGYRWFDSQGLEPLFPFGYGLSYSRFDYSDLSVGRADDGGLDVAFSLHNAGSAADEVPQIYLGPPPNTPTEAQFAPRALAAFTRVHLQSGESRRVQVHVPLRALQYWSASAHDWRLGSGARSLDVAASSRDPRLSAVTLVQP